MPPKFEKVTAKVRRNATTGIYEIKTSHPNLLPYSANDIIAFLPASKHKLANPWRHEDLGFCMRQTGSKVSAKDWANAITTFLSNTISSGIEVESEAIVPHQSLYLSMGNFLIKGEVVDHIESSNKALPVMRRRIMDDAKAEASALVRSATEEVATQRLRLQEDRLRANNELAALQVQLQQVKKELNYQPPAWLPGSGLIFRTFPNGNTPRIGVPHRFQFRRFYVHHRDASYFFNPRPLPPIPLYFWFPWRPEATPQMKAGQWNIAECGCDIGLPHGYPEIPSRGGSYCMGYEGSLPTLLRPQDYQEALKIAVYVMSEGDIGMFHVPLNSWDVYTKALLPEKLEDMLKEYRELGIWNWTEERLKRADEIVRRNQEPTILTT